MARRQSTSAGAGRSSPSVHKDLGLAWSDSVRLLFSDGLEGTSRSGGDSIEHVIEIERARLAHAQSILKCLHGALVYAEESNCAEPGYADVADVALRLIRESVHRLDSVYITPLVAQITRRVRRSAKQSPRIRKQGRS